MGIFIIMNIYIGMIFWIINIKNKEFQFIWGDIINIQKWKGGIPNLIINLNNININKILLLSKLVLFKEILKIKIIEGIIWII